MATIRQPSFAGGEISPQLHQRTDMPELLAKSLAKVRNFIITPAGAAVNRPGTRKIARAEVNDGRYRIYPFIASDTDAYVVLLQHNYFEVFKNGVAQTVTPSNVSPFDGDHLPDLKFAQLGDVLTVTHPSYRPRTLTRTSDTAWTWGQVEFDVGDAEFGFGTPKPTTASASFPAASAGHPAREWVWKVSTILTNATGRVWETEPFTVVQQTTSGGVGDVDPTFVLDEENPVTLAWTTYALTSGGLAVAHTILGYRIYRGRGNLFGWVGDTQTNSFIDYGIDPNLTIQPAASRNPFEVFASSGGTAQTSAGSHWPAAVAYFGERRIFGGSTSRPGWIWASKAGSFSNFDKKQGPASVMTAADPVELELASLRREYVRSIAGLKEAIVLTSGGVWTASGFDPTVVPAADLIKHTDEAASPLAPLIASDTLLYVREMGTGVNALVFSNERGGYTVQDISLFAQHLCDGHEIVSWAYARNPYHVAWIVRDDGYLLSLTLDEKLGTLAWAWHDTGVDSWETDSRDEFMQVVAVPEGEEHAVYVVVKRQVADSDTFNYYLERFYTRDTDGDWDGGQAETAFLDHCETFVIASPTTTLTGLLNDRTYKVIHNGDPLEGTYETDNSGVLTLETAISSGTVIAGIPYDSDLETLGVQGGRQEIRGHEKIVKSVLFDVTNSRGIKAGEDFDHLTAARARSTPESTLVEVRVRGTWNKSGKACLRQSDPLPLTVNGIAREVAVGEE